MNNKQIRKELMNDIQEYITFNDLIHKDYDEVINEFSSESLTPDEEIEIENLLFENEDRLEAIEAEKQADEYEMGVAYEAEIKWLNREYRAMAMVS